MWSHGIPACFNCESLRILVSLTIATLRSLRYRGETLTACHIEEAMVKLIAMLK